MTSGSLNFIAGAAFTVTSHVAVSLSCFSLAAMVAVIVAFPAFSPFIVRFVLSTIFTVDSLSVFSAIVSFAGMPVLISTSVSSFPSTTVTLLSSNSKLAACVSPVISQDLLLMSFVRAVSHALLYCRPVASSFNAVIILACAAQLSKLLE